MAQILKKFISDDSIDGDKILLANGEDLRALNNADSPVALLQLDSSDNILIQQPIDMNAKALSNLAAPSADSDAATKAYVDALAQGLSWKDVVRSATTAALPSYSASLGVLTASSNGALAAQDGVTLVVNDRLLVKNETAGNAPNNGIYVVTQVGNGGAPFILTRASDANTAAELQAAVVSIGSEASTLAGNIYYENLTIATINVSNVGFIIIVSAIPYTFGNGLQVISSVVSVKNSDASIAVAAGGISVLKDSAGALSVSGSGLAVAVDNSTIAISSNQVIVKAGGISNTQVSASAAIAYSKLALSNSIVNADVNSAAAIAYSKLALSNSIVNADIAAAAAIVYSKLNLVNSVKVSDINVESATNGWILMSNGSSASFQPVPTAPRASSEQFTLSPTDITNQYVDLAHQVVFASSTDNSVIFSVRGGPVQQPDVDYEVQVDSGVDDTTRLVFLNDLATGGASALVSGDVLIINYSY